MRRLLAILAALMVAAVPATAFAQQDTGDRGLEDGSVERSARAFHRFVSCLTTQYSDAAARTMVSEDWNKEFNNLRRIARDVNCSNGTGVRTLEGNRLLIRGVIGETLFTREIAGATEMPSFIGLDPLVSAETVNAAASNPAVARELLSYVFADCVVRNATPEVVALFGTTVMSKDEGTAFGALGGTMSACLPASEGTQLSFTAPALRSYFGIAAYHLQRARAGETIDIMPSTPDAASGDMGREVEN